MAAELRGSLPWAANPGPQSAAYVTTADELYYGGSAGGGKTVLGLALSLFEHRNSLLLRRTAKDTKALSESLRVIGGKFGCRWKWVGNGGEMRTPDGRVVDVGGCQHEKDKDAYQGQAHDLKFFDELPQFTESMFDFLGAWNRPRDPVRYPHQRCRKVGAGNPPMTAEGEWVRRRWSRWIEGGLASGVLRWFVRLDNDGTAEEVEVEGPEPISHKGKEYKPKSRTFIAARLEDNPALMASGYGDTLNAMPEPLRSLLRYGDMTAGLEDHPFQVIPRRWVAMAQARWAERWGWDGRGAVPTKPKRPIMLTSAGCDVARGGNDCSAVAGVWGHRTVGLPVRVSGRKLPDGNATLTLVIQYIAPNPEADVWIDTIGPGAAVYDLARGAGLPLANVKAFVASEKSERKTRDDSYRFLNTRSAAWWYVREMLDPEGGPDDTRLALPPDSQLAADLTAPRYRVNAGGVIQVEPKENHQKGGDWGIKQRLGRSTDTADAVVQACWPGEPTVPLFGWSGSKK